ncbi:MAG TPA: (deoxy)nucleoside triphosphate pyrophosphohydrolase [Bryobacteraceae bacterium]
MGKPPLIVVAAVIERDARVLICRRSGGARHHPLKWEFPGGKVEPGEEPRTALARELDEELGIRAEIGEEIESFAYQYAGRGPILLMFFRVSRFAGELVNREFDEIVWESKDRLPEYDFLEGDIEFVRRLAAPAA